MIEVFHVPPDLIERAWPDIARLVAPAINLSDGRHTLQSTADRLQLGFMEAILCLRDAQPVAVCMAQVGQYPASRWLQLPLCGGKEMSEWLEPLMDEIDKLAYENNCVGVEVSGRGGWFRALRKFGYSPDETVPSLLVKRLDSSLRKVA